MSTRWYDDCRSVALTYGNLRAKRRLADEYDAAQERGEIKSKTGPITSSAEAIATVSDIGLTHKDIHEAPHHPRWLRWPTVSTVAVSAN
jgi:hypothetical protein